MCDPISIGIGLAVAAGAVGAYGQIQQGKAANQQAKYEAKVADRNAKLADASGLDAKKRGERDQLSRWRRAAQQMGDQRAKFGASGIDVNFGTTADVLGDTSLIAYEDVQTLSDNTTKEVQGFDIQKANYTTQSVAAKARGKAAKSAGYIGAASTILGTASQIAGKFAPGGAYAKAGA